MGVRYKIKPEKGHMVEKERFINESKELIDNLDLCYLRNGRIDNCYSMMEILSLQ